MNVRRNTEKSKGLGEVIYMALVSWERRYDARVLTTPIIATL